MSDIAAITSRPWANLASYTDAEWHLIYQTLFDGSEERGPLLNYGSEFAVSASSPAAMTVSVGTGAAFVGGAWCQNEEAQTLDVATNGGGAARYDLVFLHWTRATQQVAIRIVDGTAATCAAAVAPAANAIATYQNAGPPVSEWAVPLACITVAPGATSIAAGNITDLREFSRFRTDPGDLPDGSTVDESAGHQLRVADGGIGADQIAAAIAGDGLDGGAGSALEVNVDGTTIEINADTLRVAATCAGDGLTGGAGAALDVNVDAATITIPVDTLEVGILDESYFTNRARYLWVGANELYPGAGAPTPAWGTVGSGALAAEGWIFPQSNYGNTGEYVVGHVRVPADAVSGSAYPALYFVVAISTAVAVNLRGIGFTMTHVTARACDGDLTGGTSDVTASLQDVMDPGNVRKCIYSGGTNTMAIAAGDYIDFHISRGDLAAGITAYPYDVALLGFYLAYTGDM